MLITKVFSVIVSGKKYLDTISKVMAFANTLDQRLIATHEALRVSKPSGYQYELPFYRENSGELFDICFDAVMPDDIDFKATYPTIKDQTYAGFDLRRRGYETIRFSFWTVDMVTVHFEPTRVHLREMLRTAQKERQLKANEGPNYYQIIETIERFATPAWSPVVEIGVAGDLTDSRFSGDPWLPDDVNWPVDLGGEPMLFIAQLNVAQLPLEMQSIVGTSGLISVFSSRLLSGVDEAATSSSPDAALFRFTLEETGSVRTNAVVEEFRTGPSRILRWRCATDHPSRHDLESSLLDLPTDVQEAVKHLGDNAIGSFTPRDFGEGDRSPASAREGIEYLWGKGSYDKATAERSMRLSLLAGNKLGGWPCWVEKSQWKLNSGQPMLPLFQFCATDGLALQCAALTCQLFVDPGDTNIMKITSWRSC